MLSEHEHCIDIAKSKTGFNERIYRPLHGLKGDLFPVDDPCYLRVQVFTIEISEDKILTDLKDTGYTFDTAGGTKTMPCHSFQ